MKESVILCEGYHDRAFWAGWLTHLGCTDPGTGPGKPGRQDVRDPWDGVVAGGQHGFHSRTGKFIRTVPCRGDTKRVLVAARERLNKECDRWRQQATETRLARLILAVDPDVSADGTSTRTGFRREDLRALVQEYDPSPTENEHGDLLLFDARVRVSLIRWEVPDAPADGLPNQQTLERLVCAALVAAYPDRGPAVQKWLDSRPQAPDAGPKEFAWSQMAGWYARFGCEAFYRELWGDDRVVSELRPRLTECGAWRIAESLAE